MSSRAPLLQRREAWPGPAELEVVTRRRAARATRAPRRAAPMVVLAIVCAAAVVFGVLLEQVVLAQSAFKLAGLRAELRAAEARHEELLLEAARLSSSARIERLARGSLGMVDPREVEYVVADVGRRGAVADIGRRGAHVAAVGGMAAPRGGGR